MRERYLYLLKSYPLIHFSMYFLIAAMICALELKLCGKSGSANL